MSNSSLVSKFIRTSKMSSPRNHAIDTITPHYSESDGTAEGVATYLRDAPDRRASANYYIGMAGEVVQSVDEANRSWCSSSSTNDNRAVTIECNCYIDNKNGHVYGQLTDAAWRTLVELCADICRRNGKTRLVYRGKADYSGLASTDMLLTMHKFFIDTDCPGQWLGARFAQLASEVNAKLSGGEAVTKVSIADIAARIHYDMVTDPRNGYSQKPDRWGGDYGGTKTLNLYGRNYTYKLGSYDCSSSEITAWRLALQGTPYEGALDGATYTSDMQAAFVNSGLFTASLTPAKRGDLYLTPGDHTAMCQDGGSDGVFGYDCLSEFNMNENRGASYGKPGDQTGYESVFRAYYDRPWRTVLHYNGKADYYINTGSVMKITPHCQTFGWRGQVTETDVVGTTGQSKALEGLKFELPDGIEFKLELRIQKMGIVSYGRVCKGEERFVFGSANAFLRIEAIKFTVTANTNPATKGKRLQYRAHCQTYGWMDWKDEGEWAGTINESKRLEAFQCRWV